MTEDESPRKWWAFAAVGSGVLMATIDNSIVNIALETLRSVFRSSLHVVEWVALAYLLTITCLLLLMGRLGDLFGKRRVCLGGFVVFTAGSALCGLAPSVGALIGFRVLQAVGAAMLQAAGPALLVTAFPARERGVALGGIGSVVAAGILLGPVLGGVLLKHVGWESIFLVNIPIGVAGALLTLRSLPPDTAPVRSQRFDGGGALLLLASLLGLLLGLTQGPQWGWGDARVLGLLGGFLLFGALFFWWEARRAEPMVDLAIFRSKAFSYSLLASFVVFTALSFGQILTPLFLQLVSGFDAQKTGLVLMSTPLVLSAVAPVSGRLSDRIGTLGLTMAGLSVLVVALAGLGTFGVASSLPHMVAVLMLLGLGFGLFQSPNNSTVMGSAPAEALGVASGLLSMVRTLGQTGGIAVAGALWSSRIAAQTGAALDPMTAPPPALAAAYAQTQWIAAAVAAAAIVPALIGGRAARRAAPRASAPAADRAPAGSIAD